MEAKYERLGDRKRLEKAFSARQERADESHDMAMRLGEDRLVGSEAGRGLDERRMAVQEGAGDLAQTREQRLAAAMESDQAFRGRVQDFAEGPHHDLAERRQGEIERRNMAAEDLEAAKPKSGMLSPEQRAQSLFEIRMRLADPETPPPVRALLQGEFERLAVGEAKGASRGAAATNLNTVVQRLKNSPAIAELAKTLKLGGDKVAALRAWSQQYFPDVSDPNLIRQAITVAMQSAPARDAYADARWDPDEAGGIMGRLAKPEVSGAEQREFNEWFKKEHPLRNMKRRAVEAFQFPSADGFNRKNFREFWKQQKAARTLDKELAQNLR